MKQIGENICPACGTSNPVGSTSCRLCGAPLAVVSLNLPLGTKLREGRYSVGRVLGRGGFAITYQGGDAVLTRAVAIKELFPEGCVRQGTTVRPSSTLLNDFPQIKLRFLEEARLLAKLKHRSIVEVYDFFEENNTAYMVMELLRGKTLKDLIDERGRIEEKEALDYILPICDALRLLHKEGYIHRDIKPDNIFLTDDGRVVLIDFGAAREFAAGIQRSHTVILTPGYAPNEQYSQRTERGPYTDIYALSATLYHLLTGETPVDAPARANGVPLPVPKQLNSQISDRISDAIIAGMEIDPKRRPQSIDEFLSLLREKKKTAPRTASRSSKSKPTSPTFQKVEDVVGFKCKNVFSGGLSGNAGAIMCLVFSQDSSVLVGGGSGKVLNLWRVDTGEILPSPGKYSTSVLSTTFHPDGEILSAGGWQNTKVWCTKGDKLLRVISGHTQSVHKTTFSSDGSFLASGDNGGEIKVWRLNDGVCIGSFKGEAYAVSSLAFSNDGKFLAGGSYKRITLWNLLSGSLHRTMEVHNDYVMSLAFSPAGDILLSGGKDGTIKIWQVSDGKLLYSENGHKGVVNSLAFSPDGKFFASGGDDKFINIWRTKDAIILQTLEGHSASVLSLTFSPNGLYLASGGADGLVYLWERDADVASQIKQYLIQLGLSAASYFEQIQPVIDSLTQYFELAYKTPRINLPSVIPFLQQAVLQLHNIEVSPYIAHIHQNFLEVLDFSIKGLISFSQNLHRGAETTIASLLELWSLLSEGKEVEAVLLMSKQPGLHTSIKTGEPEFALAMQVSMWVVAVSSTLEYLARLANLIF